MLRLRIGPGRGGRLSLLAVGAHPDDIEIGAGGTLLSLSRRGPDLDVRYVVMTGVQDRRREAEQAARCFLPTARLTTEFHGLPDGHLPGVWAAVKDALESVAGDFRPDLVLGPSPDDAHQDHRTVAGILPTVFRDSLHLSYELPKWDGDLSRPSVYVPLSPETMDQKVQLLDKCYPSQMHRDWWGEELFTGLARMRGVECRARYAEAFGCTKAVLAL